MLLRSQMASTSRVRLISHSASPRRSTVGEGGVLSLTPLGTDAGFAATLEAARTGDEQAISALYRLVHPRISRFLRVIHPATADELAGATWLDVVADLPAFRGDSAALVAHGLAIAYRRANDQPRRALRRDRRERARAHASVDGRPDLNGLPRAAAEVLLLRVLGGMSVDEVAEVTSRRRSSVRLLQRLALRRLARMAERGRGSR